MPLPLIVPAALFLVLVFILRNKGISKLHVAIGIPFLFFIIISINQSIVSGASSPKTFVDMYRWALIGFSVVIFSPKDNASFAFGFYYFFILTFFYCVIQQVVPEATFVQWLNSQYVSDDLMAELFVPGFVRSTGFNQGPGHVGLVAFAGLLTAHVIFPKESSKKYTLVANYFMACSIVIMAAAKGAAIAIVLYVFLKNTKKHGHYIIILAVVTAGIAVCYLDEFYFLYRLFQFESGTERFVIWESIVNSMDINALTLLFGHGRVGRLANTSIFDSDVIFLFATQGLVGVFMLATLVLCLIKRFSKSWGSSLVLTFVILLAGMSNPFLTDIKYGVIYFCLLISFKDFQKNENLHYHH